MRERPRRRCRPASARPRAPPLTIRVPTLPSGAATTAMSPANGRLSMRCPGQRAPARPAPSLPPCADNDARRGSLAIVMAAPARGGIEAAAAAHPIGQEQQAVMGCPRQTAWRRRHAGRHRSHALAAERPGELFVDKRRHEFAAEIAGETDLLVAVGEESIGRLVAMTQMVSAISVMRRSLGPVPAYVIRSMMDFFSTIMLSIGCHAALKKRP